LLAPSTPILRPASPMVSVNVVFDFALSSPRYFFHRNRSSSVLNRRSVRASSMRFWLSTNETRCPPPASPQAIPDAIIRRDQIVRRAVDHCLF
jgi:hypothetical protein